MNYVALERHYFLVAFINFLILQIMKLSNVRTLPLRRWEYAMTRQHRGGYHIGFRSGEFYSPYWRSRDDASFGGNIVATGTRNIPEYFVTGGYGLRRNASSMVGPQRTDLRKWRSLDSESRPIDGHTNASGTESGWRSRGQCGGAAGTPALWRVMSFNILADSLVDQKYDILVRLSGFSVCENRTFHSLHWWVVQVSSGLVEMCRFGSRACDQRALSGLVSDFAQIR